MRGLFSIAIAALVAALTLAPGTAEAHETREILGGKYRVVVGFLNEPVFVGDKSGLDLRITDNPPATDGAEPERTGIEGLEATLKAEGIYGDQRMELPLEPVFRQPGAYASYFYPAATGDYTFRIYGTINGEEVDESFTSGPETFGPVEERIEFPAPSASTNAMASTIEDDGLAPNGLLAGLGAGIVLGAAGVWMVMRQRSPRRSL